uniref:Homeodomain-only protein n=1 Tax=Sus scrofa TaxID=9823 RepID=A0A8D1RD46_PIG
GHTRDSKAGKRTQSPDFTVNENHKGRLVDKAVLLGWGLAPSWKSPPREAQGEQALLRRWDNGRARLGRQQLAGVGLRIQALERQGVEGGGGGGLRSDSRRPSGSRLWSCRGKSLRTCHRLCKRETRRAPPPCPRLEGPLLGRRCGRAGTMSAEPANGPTEDQVEILEYNFNKVNRHPDPTTLCLIAAEAGLSEEETQKWFKQRLAQWRRSEGLPSECRSVTD